MFDVGWPDINLPTDPVGYIKGKAIELLNHLGYEWPTTDTGVLDAWAEQWAGVAATLEGHAETLESGIAHIKRNNEGPTVESFSSFMSGDDSAVGAVAAMATAAPLISSAYAAAADIVALLKLAVVAELLLDAISLAMAIMTGGMAAGASFLLKQGAGAVISILIDQAVMEIVGR